MGFISKKKKVNKFHKRNLEREFASQIFEILEEKLDELNVNLPREIKNELVSVVSEIEEFIVINKRILSKKIA